MNDHPLKWAIDGLSVGTAIATIAGWLPNIAALFTIVWTAVRIYESKTAQRLMSKWGWL